jgi:multidrug efflux pump subunit AcrA (membrane-fusion protein)
VITVGIIALVLAGIGAFFHFYTTGQTTQQETTKDLPQVEVKAISQLNNENSFSITGTVKAVSEARLQAESGGRITSVNVELGDTVPAGTVIATLENSAQRAALLQAEGSYEAALASAASSEISVESAEEAVATAKDSAITTYRSAYITVESILRNDIDDLFTITNDTAIGIRIDAKGQANTLNGERNALDTAIAQWQTKKDAVTPSSIQNDLDDKIELVRSMSAFVETLSTLLNDTEVTTSFTQADKDAMVTAIYSARASLNGVAQNLKSADDAITSALNAQEQALLSGSSAESSAASAQVKIALGSLRSAQSAYQKTIIRTPIGGVVNALYLKEGEYASPSQEAVIIANNNALEITAFVNQTESEQLEIGQDVVIDESIEGTITQIAPAIDANTGKIEIKIQTESDQVKNGDTVRLSFTQIDAIEQNDQPKDIIIPITALKVETDRIVVFTVGEDMRLVAHPITEGPLLGNTIIVKDGLDASMRIVLDARGLNEGDEVSVADY